MTKTEWLHAMCSKRTSCVLLWEKIYVHGMREHIHAPGGTSNLQGDKTWMLNKLPSNTAPSPQQYISHLENSDILNDKFHIRMEKK